MKYRTLLAALVLGLTGLVAGPAHATVAAGGHQLGHHHHHHPCTRTSSGTCIRGGQFCPQSKYGQNGWDAKGRRYVCKGDHQHPHWMKP